MDDQNNYPRKWDERPSMLIVFQNLIPQWNAPLRGKGLLCKRASQFCTIVLNTFFDLKETLETSIFLEVSKVDVVQAICLYI